MQVTQGPNLVNFCPRPPTIIIFLLHCNSYPKYNYMQKLGCKLDLPLIYKENFELELELLQIIFRQTVPKLITHKISRFNSKTTFGVQQT